MVLCSSCSQQRFRRIIRFLLLQQQQERKRRSAALLSLLLLPCLIGYVTFRMEVGIISKPITLVKRKEVPYLGPSYGNQWWETYVDQVASPFLPKQLHKGNDDNPSWCIMSTSNNNTASSQDEEDDENKRQGIWFVKNYKAASSTGAGITARMAHTIAQRNQQRNQTQRSQPQPQQSCLYRADHEFAESGHHYKYGRNPSNSLLWSIVRHPSSRVQSLYFYFRPPSSDVERNKNHNDRGISSSTSDPIATFKAVAGSEKNRQVTLLDVPSSDDKPFAATNTNSKDYNHQATRIKQILHEYDFIAVQERLEESLVVFKMLMSLKDWDIVVLSAKQHGSYALDPRGKCTRIPNTTTAFTSLVGVYDNAYKKQEQINHYLTIDFPNNNYDYLLHAAVNRSLDMTIDRLGRNRVEQEVSKHMELQNTANKVCQKEAYFPCSKDGKRQTNLAKTNCYHQDWGCGYPCLDRLMNEYQEKT